jgi:hypothetical protein
VVGSLNITLALPMYIDNRDVSGFNSTPVLQAEFYHYSFVTNILEFSSFSV